MKTRLYGLMALFSIVAGAFSAPVVTIKATAAKSGGLTETQVRSGDAVSLVSVAEAGSITAPAFGFEIVAKDGEVPVDGMWTIDYLTYTIRINGEVAKDAAGKQIFNRQLGAFNVVGGAGPDIRGLDGNLVNSVAYSTQTAGVTINGTSSIILSAHIVNVTGTSLRPLLENLGNFYSIEYKVKGTYDGVPFDKVAVALVVIGLESFWFDVTSLNVWRGGDILDYDPVPGDISNNTDFFRRVRIAKPGVGEQYVIIGFESTTDLKEEWEQWPTQVSAVIPEQAVVLRATNAYSDPSRVFKVRYIRLGN